MDDDALHRQLLKLSSSLPPPEESLNEVFETLWQTRKTGLSPHQKSTVLSLLKLHSLQELDPVLACLRSIIRKSVNESLCDEDTIRDVFPLEISAELQNSLILLLTKYQSQWREELPRNQLTSKRARVCNQLKMMSPTTIASSTTIDCSPTVWSMEDSKSHRNCNYIGVYEPVPASLNLPLTTTTSLQHDSDMTALPYLNSMTWRLEDRSLVPASRTAIVSLMLQDNINSCASETEIKFHITKDTLEALLRSMTYISESLSNTHHQQQRSKINDSAPPSTTHLKESQSCFCSRLLSRHKLWRGKGNVS